MESRRYELHSSAADRSLLSETAPGYRTVGLSGLLEDRGHRARRVRVPGSGVVDGYRWRLADCWDSTWWPQGIAVTEHNQIPLLVTSWYAQEKRGHKMGARISVLDLRDVRRPRYHHVLLVTAQRREGSIHFDPVHVHAGGIIVAGDRLLVAATFGGMREFLLSDIIRTPSTGRWRKAAGPFAYRHLLPESAGYRPAKAPAIERLRYSFVGLETGTPDLTDAATDAPGDAPTGVALVTGEYSPEDQGRLGRMLLADGRTTIERTHVPTIPRMQGAVIHNGVWFVTASRGHRTNGDLWVGEPGAMTRHAGVLPPGPEDIAAWPDRDQLWSVSEFPRKRWVYAVGLSRWSRPPVD